MAGKYTFGKAGMYAKYNGKGPHRLTMVPGARGELEPSGKWSLEGVGSTHIHPTVETMTSLFGCANCSYDVLPGQHHSFLSVIVIRYTPFDK